jgi:hypothetical protein
MSRPVKIGGREDSISPVKTSQIPMYELLGTPDEDKEHKIFPEASGIRYAGQDHPYSRASGLA